MGSGRQKQNRTQPGPAVFLRARGVVRLGVLGLIFASLAAAQPPQFLSLAAGPPSPIVILTAQANSPVGAGSYCYWVIANYLIGHSTPSSPGCLNNAGTSVTVNWTTVPNASSYDILRTTTPILPNITSNIAVATLSGPGPIVDNFGALTSYSVNTTAPASAIFLLDNQNQANPQVRLTISNTAGFFSSFLLNAGGGVPGGANGTVQFNSAGFFGGFNVSGDFTLNTSTGVGTLATVNGSPGTCGDSTHVSQIVFNAKGLGTSCTAVAITAGTGNAAAIVTLAFSATPTYTAPSATAGTVVDFQNTSGNPIVLTGNITSSTLSGATPGSILNFLYKQDGTGHRTVVMPAGFSPPVIHPAPNITTALTYWVDNGGNGRLISSFSDAGYSACSEGTAPTDTPPAGVEYSSCDSTRGTALQINAAGQNHIMPRTAQAGDQLGFGDLLNSATTSQLPSVVLRRICDIAIGDKSGSAITNAQLGPQSRLCYVPAASTIVEMDVAADGGTPNVIVGRNHAGTISNIVSAALATAASGGIACSNTGGTTGIDGATTCTNTLQNTALAAGDYLELVSGTAGGTAKLMTIHVIYTVN